MANKPRKSVWEYTAVLHDSTNGDQVVVEPATILAVNDEHARRVAERAIPDGYDDRLEDIEVVVRPFRH